MTFQHRVPDPRAHTKRGCQLVTYPTAGSTIAAQDQLTVTWDTDCLNSLGSDVSGLAITVSIPSASNPRVHEFTGVKASAGSTAINVQPKWWNNTASVNAKLVFSDEDAVWETIGESGQFTFTYDAKAYSSVVTDTASAAAALNTTASEDGTTYESVANQYNGGGLAKGSIAAAVIFPLLAVFGAVAAYVIWTRKKEAKKRKRWSQHVDKRMSRISTDWRPSIGGSGGPGSASVRNTRASSFFARPNSTMAAENGSINSGYFGQGDIGAGHGDRFSRADEFKSMPSPEMRQTRTSAFFNSANGSNGRMSTLGDNAAARQSRISFAPVEAGQRQSRVSFGDALRPTSTISNGGGSPTHPVTTVSIPRSSPLARASAIATDDLALSPSQVQGPSMLSVEDLTRPRSYVEMNAERESMDGAFRREMLNMPAVAAIRTSRESHSPSSDIFTPAPPPPIATGRPLIGRAQSSATGSSTLSTAFPMPAPASGVSPDDALRAYAERKAAASGSSSPAMTPMGMAAGPNLRLPASPAPSANRLTVASIGTNNPFRQSMLEAASASSASPREGASDNRASYFTTASNIGAAK